MHATLKFKKRSTHQGLFDWLKKMLSLLSSSMMFLESLWITHWYPGSAEVQYRYGIWCWLGWIFILFCFSFQHLTYMLKGGWSHGCLYPPLLPHKWNKANWSMWYCTQKACGIDWGPIYDTPSIQYDLSYNTTLSLYYICYSCEETDIVNCAKSMRMSTLSFQTRTKLMIKSQIIFMRHLRNWGLI